MLARDDQPVSVVRPHRPGGGATDPLLVGVAATAVCALHGYQGGLDRDLGVFTYGGEHVASGVPPYADVFNSVGPLSDALPGLAIWVGRQVGVDPVSAERHFYTLLVAGCCALLCVLARDVLGSRAAGFVAPAALLTFQEFVELASDGPRDKTAVVVFLLAALVLLGRRRWTAAGVCTALATLTWQPALAVAVAAAAVSAAGATTGRVRAAAAYVAGGVATTAVFVAYFLLHGDLGRAIDGFVIVNAEYTRQPSLVTAPYAVLDFLWRGYHETLLLLPVGLVALFVMAARAVPRAVRGESAPPGLPLVAVGAGALAGTAWTVAVINGAPDLFELLPLGSLGAAGLVVRLAALLGPRAGRVLVASATTIALATATGIAIGTRADKLVRERADVAAVLAAAPPGATVLSVNTPQVLALAGLTNPTDYQIFEQPMDSYLQHTWPGGIAGYAAWVARDRPTVIAFAGHGQRWIAPVLRRDYRYVGHGSGWGWYLSRTAGTRELTAMRAANLLAR